MHNTVYTAQTGIRLHQRLLTNVSTRPTFTVKVKYHLQGAAEKNGPLIFFAVFSATV